MTGGRRGQVVTFYSYKGGTGRTMAIANVAWILAANGRRVLVVDWDLESPGLHRFFTPFIDPDALRSTGGVIDLIREYEWAATRRNVGRPVLGRAVRPGRTSTRSRCDWRDFPGDGDARLPVGRPPEPRLRDRHRAASNWDDFYDRQGGGAFFDALRADMKRHYDYTLIDSRTGLSDIADICTIHLPDVLVDCFTLSEQGIDGAAAVADLVRKRSDRSIRILPVPMRVDPAERGRADIGRLVAQQRFAGLPFDRGRRRA